MEVPADPLSQSSACLHPLGPLTLIDGAVERFLIRKFRVEAVLRVVGPSSVGVTVPTDLRPLVGQGLRASIGKALQYHIVAL